MSRVVLRQLSEAQACRAVSAGGMLIEAGGRWKVYRGRDARRKPAGWIPPRIFQRLESEGFVRPDADRPERRVSAGRQVQLPLHPIAPALKLGIARPVAARISLFASLMSDAATASEVRIRLKAAGHRFLVDLRQAAGPEPAAATARLAAVESAIGLQAVRQLEALIGEAMPVAAFARSAGCREGEARGMAQAALTSLARVYDLIGDGTLRTPLLRP